MEVKDYYEALGYISAFGLTFLVAGGSESKAVSKVDDVADVGRALEEERTLAEINEAEKVVEESGKVAELADEAQAIEEIGTAGQLSEAIAGEAAESAGVTLENVPNRGFRSFKELKKELGHPGAGKAWHHIVEQAQIEKSGFISEEINNINNVISIPHGKGTVHAKISGYYSSKQFFTGGHTVRQWLAGQSFQEQFNFGMDLLKEYGTVIPTTKGWIFTPF